MLRHLWLPALILTAPVQAADIFKWQDASGRVHYTATPPAHGIPFQRLNKPAPPPSDAAAALQKLREQAGLDGSAETGQEQVALRAQACEKAKANQAVLEQHDTVARPGADGRQVVMSPEERAEALRQTLKEVDFYCNP